MEDEKGKCFVPLFYFVGLLVNKSAQLDEQALQMFTGK